MTSFEIVIQRVILSIKISSLPNDFSLFAKMEKISVVKSQNVSCTIFHMLILDIICKLKRVYVLDRYSTAGLVTGLLGFL